MNNLEIAVSVASIVGVAIALLALIISFFQSLSVRRLNETNAIIFFVTKMIEEGEIKETINMLDVDPNSEAKGWYNSDFYKTENRVFAFKIDKTLTFLSYICYLLLKKRISYKEFSLAEYKINAVLLNTDVRKYLWNLDCYSKQMVLDKYFFNGLLKSPFGRRQKTSYYYLIQYGIKAGILDKDFRKQKVDKKHVNESNKEDYKTRIIF